ncbi:MAG: hypothetical protein LUH03_09825 [Oscillospiraceae bacterium]|nr:hypothetical protein [Oscillospiraceae bacterium]
MKKGVEVWPDYDKEGRWVLHLRKERGKFTVQEVQEILTEYDEGFYLLVLDCIDHGEPQFGEDAQGEHLIAYTMESIRKGEQV